MTEIWHTVVEVASYRRNAERLMTEPQRKHVIDTLAQYPESGDVISGGGGIRKVRFAAKGKGKSGGVRVIYYYHSVDVPLFLLTIFGKGERANLSRQETNELAKAVKLLADEYGD